MNFRHVKDVAAWRLCVGCGACVRACPEGNVTLVDVETDGLRPLIKSEHCKSCGECLQVCPGVSVRQERSADATAELAEGWGNVLEVWEGYAADPDIRFNGSSGGLASALALYCLEKGGMSGVLHTGPDPNRPFKNKSHFSRSRAELLERSGSRYAPASPCDSIGWIEEAPGPSLLIGKGCDVEAVRKVEGASPELGAKIGLAIGIFCAGTPSTQATLDLLARLGVDPGGVADVRYRGKGWPGNFTVTMSNGRAPVSILYMEAWSFLQKYRPFRCYLCPDATAELADISCGDPWYRRVKEDPLGFSLVLVRTERGRRIVRGAIEAGYVVLAQREPDVLVQSQPGMFDKRGAIWGRMFAMKLFGIPTPRYEGFHLFENWKRLPAGEKARAFLGTVRRIVTRGYYRRASTAPLMR